MIATLLTVLRKELLETVRDRRSLASSLLMGPVLGPLLFIFALSLSLEQSVSALDDAVPVTVSGAEHAPQLVQHLRQRGLTLTLREGATEEIPAWIEGDGELVVLAIPADLGQRLLDGVRAEVAGYAGTLAALRLQARGVSPAVVQPIVVDDVDLSTPTSRATLVLGMLSYIMLVVMLVGGLSLAIDDTAGGRERGSLEPLLTAPVPLSERDIVEVPLEVWIHKRGSKLDPAQMAKAGLDLARVTDLVEQVAYHVVRPRFGHLEPGDVADKGVNDPVTVVDTAAEAALTAGLGEIAPAVPVVGEEAVAADASVLRAVGAQWAFVVDPIDGTQAFVDGLPDYAVMVALLAAGDPVASWICLPSRAQTWVAERGAGVWRSGERVYRQLAPAEPARVHVSAPGATRASGTQDLPGLRIGRPLWAGRSYTALAAGEVDALGYWYGRPWDHAPGAVLVRELGGVVTVLDGSPYRAVPQSPPIVAATDPALAQRVRALLAQL